MQDTDEEEDDDNEKEKVEASGDENDDDDKKETPAGVKHVLSSEREPVKSPSAEKRSPSPSAFMTEEEKEAALVSWLACALQVANCISIFIKIPVPFKIRIALSGFQVFCKLGISLNK